MKTCDVCGRAVAQLDLGIYHADDGTPGCAGADGLVRATSAPGPDQPPVCDLCGDPDPGDGWLVTKRVNVDVLDVDTLTSLTQSMSPVWGCCPACEHYALSGQPERIVNRAVDRLVSITPSRVSVEMDWEAVRLQIADLHLLVWQGWDGVVHHGQPPDDADV